jgi:N-acetylglucosaminyldiphosphoundecaprenol N-acetyl-beta-D-mannosaminyltransferase
MTGLLPRASLLDVVAGRASLVGSRLDEGARRGVFSPVEARVHMGIPYGELDTAEREYLARRSPLHDAGVVARTALSQCLFPRATGPSKARPFVVSAFFDDLTIAEAVEEIAGEVGGPRAKMIHFAHAHALNLAVLDGALRDRLLRADRVLADGIGIRTAASLLGTPLSHNLNGTDLLPHICRRAVETQRPMVLVGGKPGIADAAAARLAEAHPGLSFPVVSHGYLDEEEAGALRARIEELDRPIILVGMGSPLQEEFAWKNFAMLGCATVVTVGGLFDFYAEKVRRAPVAVRELGLEWLYRMAQEPRRLAGRYLLGNPAFLALACAQRMGVARLPARSDDG